MRDLVEATIPAFYLGLPFQSHHIKPLGGGVWDVSARYGKKEQKDTGDSSFSFDTGGGTTHITQSLDTIAKRAPAGKTAPDFKGAIGVSTDSVEGTDITIPVYNFTETHCLATALVTDSASRQENHIGECPGHRTRSTKCILQGEEGGMASNGRRFSFFFAHDGRDYLIEDHYCPRPSCDCRTVHVEFWERIDLRGRSPRVDVVQHLMAVITFDGKLNGIQFSKDDRHAAEALSQAWIRHCGRQLDVIRERYRQVKAIGQRTR